MVWEKALCQQIYLSDEQFVERMQALAAPQRTVGASVAREIPKAQRSKPRTLAQWLSISATREEAPTRAYTESGLSMTAIARELSLSISRVSRLIAKAEAATPERQR